MIWLILIATVVVIFYIGKTFKVPKYGTLCQIDGGVKAGKSTMATWLAWRAYINELFKWFIYNYIILPTISWLPFKKCKALKKTEKPLLYSNIPLAFKCGYVPITPELLERKKRFRYKSVILIDEMTLIADSQLIKDKELNEKLLLFFKLIGHETKGHIIFTTHTTSDCHYAVKRTTSAVHYNHHLTKLPFFVIIYVRELFYSEDFQAINVYETDLEDTLKKVIIPKKIWKMFDSYCYSSLTDNLPVEDRVVKKKKGESLKVEKLVSFREFTTIPKNFIMEREKENERKEPEAKD